MLSELSEEFESINDENFRNLAVEGISKTIDELEDDIPYIKRVIRIAREMCAVLDADDVIYDIVTTSCILHIVCKYEVDEHDIRRFDGYHMLKVRGYLMDLLHHVGRDKYNDIMSLIEAQNGFHSVIPQVSPRLEDPCHMWILPMSIHLANKIYLE
jgi:hypothetical protein